MLLSTRTHASGFPTVDIAALVQRIMDYISQYQQYSTQLETYYTDVQQLYQMYEDYEQQIREYQHMLDQMQALSDYLKDGDAEAAIRAASELYSSNPLFGNTFDESNSDYDDARKGTDLLYGARLSDAEIRALINKGKYSSDSRKIVQSQWAEIYANDALAIQQIGNSAKNKKSLADLIDLRSQSRDLIDTLGPEDHLATLQALAEQNQVMMQMFEDMIKNQDQSYSESNRFVNQINRNRSLELQWQQQKQPQKVKLERASNNKYLHDF